MSRPDPFHIDGPIEVIAHRGYSARAPENTLAALELAMEAGADALEFDLHAAVDGTPFLFHDDTLERTTDGEGAIGATSPERLALLDAGSWFGERFRGEPVPTLDDALDRACGRVARLYAEVKGWGHPTHLAGMVDRVGAAGLLERTVFISLEWTALDQIRTISPGSPIGYVVERADRIGEAMERAGGDARALLDLDARLLLADPGIAELARHASIELATWTVNDVESAARLLRQGVRRVTTDEVERLVAWKATL